MKYSKIVLLVLMLTPGLSIINANACTTLTLKDQQGAVYQGRTMEFTELPFYVNYCPKLTKFVSRAPKGKTGLEFIAKYAFIGISNHQDLAQAFITDGVNSKGLTVAVNAFHGSSLPAVSHKVLDATNLGSWILSQFGTITEVKVALAKQAIWQGSELFANREFPFHLAVFDRSGKGIVIEYINGKQIIHDNPVGVLTNGPDFTWHLTNLNNYANLSNVGNARASLNGYAIKAVDIGGNLLGLPSDDMSPSRFVRAAFYANYAQKPEPAHAITTLGKIMNKFDRIRGITADKNGMVELALPQNKAATTENAGEWVVWTSLTDLNNSVYYIRPEHSLNYCKFELNKIAQQSRAFSFLVSKLSC